MCRPFSSTLTRSLKDTPPPRRSSLPVRIRPACRSWSLLRLYAGDPNSTFAEARRVASHPWLSGVLFGGRRRSIIHLPRHHARPPFRPRRRKCCVLNRALLAGANACPPLVPFVGASDRMPTRFRPLHAEQQCVQWFAPLAPLSRARAPTPTQVGVVSSPPTLPFVKSGSGSESEPLTRVA